VRGAGVSGDTSGGGLARADFSVQPDTDICVVELGANDLLQGVDPKVTRGNLDRIVGKLQARKIGMVLVGMRPPGAIGAGYARDVAAIYPAIAKARGVPLYPDLLAGVGPALRQRDGLHPTAQGAQVIAHGLAPIVAKALAARR
jgi:acyl-CoA thioesterase-1